LHQPISNSVAGDKHDWNGRGRRLRSAPRVWASRRSKDRHLTANEIGGERGQVVISAHSPAIFDRYVTALDELGFAKATTECSHKVCSWPGRLTAEEPNHRFGLLRAHRQRPSGCRAAKNGDELATPHGVHPKA
jgi:hypothetical protein